MTFLSKLGSIILKATEVIMGFGPLVSMTVPATAGAVTVITNDLQQIAGIITSVEAAGQALQIAGPQKLIAATPLVAQAILQSSLLANHKIANEVLFKQGAQKIADGMADVLNSLHDSVETVSKT
jgi:hypothetical protein